MKPGIPKAKIDRDSKFITVRYEVIIKNKPEAIWEYAYRPATWTASNADEHLGLVFYNDKNRPETGTAFYQKERVAGVYSDLRGHILWSDRPNVCIWTGVGRYRLFGFSPINVPLSGVLQLEFLKGSTRMSHTLYGRYPDTLLGKLFFFISKQYSKKESYVPHAYKELLYFKEKLDRS